MYRIASDQCVPDPGLVVSDSVSDPDSYPDPRGSALILVGWIPIRIRIGNADPDPGGLKRSTKIEKVF